ncbi:hypothetical protein BUALT_Bualt09G0048500 [Buddleja alternifolia]|uniref:Uncharacterized protein n=1 Tax=Buddleja alternifolia TaxID=168488 RepID=A0AAV6X0M6_9LAMI|nr:hypothetical protein BUALT_Bualt09G0048500 [Buddleja alternifolia]
MGDEERRRHGYTIDEALSTLGFDNFQGWHYFSRELNGNSWCYHDNVWINTTMFGSGLLSAFSPNYKSLTILRFFLGFGAGGTHVFSSWYLEFISSSDRGARVLALSAFWTCGELLEASFAWIIMPRLGWRWHLALSSLPSLRVLRVSSFILESPRYLFMKGRTIEAIRVLEKVAVINRKELPTGNLISDPQRIQIHVEDVPSEETHPLLSSTEKQTKLPGLVIAAIIVDRLGCKLSMIS